MFRDIKNHPFAIEAFFDLSLVLTFAFSKEQLTPLLPCCLELDTFDNQFGFLAVAIVDAKNMRIKGFPSLLGTDFLLVGYRIFVKYITNNGKRLRGLYILGSQTDKKLMKIMGNIFTHYKYEQKAIRLSRNQNRIVVAADTPGLFIQIETNETNALLPADSPFADWKEARRFAGPLPFTFSYDTDKQEVLIVEGVRENWIPQPIEVIEYNIPFIKDLRLEKGTLANAFIIKNISYYWRKGEREIWRQ